MNRQDSEELHDAIIYLVNFAKEHLDEKQFEEFIYQMYIRGIENVFIQETPIYMDCEYHGHVLTRYVKELKYAIGVKHEAASYVDSLKGNEPHMVTLELDEDEI